MLHAPEEYRDLRNVIASVSAEFPEQYLRDIDEQRGASRACVGVLAIAGRLPAFIPTNCGGSRFGSTTARFVMEEIHRCGVYARACVGEIYDSETLRRHGSEAEKQKLPPDIASGKVRTQPMAVTELASRTDTTKTKAFAVKKGEEYVIAGQKARISWVHHSDLVIVLARTGPLPDAKRSRTARPFSFICAHRSATARAVCGILMGSWRIHDFLERNFGVQLHSVDFTKVNPKWSKASTLAQTVVY
jgi:acyl-CoA dehydrogenase